MHSNNSSIHIYSGDIWYSEKELGVEEVRMRAAMEFGNEPVGRKEKLKLGLGAEDATDEE